VYEYEIMKKNNDSIEFQSNFKRLRIEEDLTNLLENHCLKKKSAIIILVIEIKSEEYIYK
jgi:phenylpyruvate tautomerase PptA (4-oxalocrotonate tautomerase family)